MRVPNAFRVIMVANMAFLIYGVEITIMDTSIATISSQFNFCQDGSASCSRSTLIISFIYGALNLGGFFGSLVMGSIVQKSRRLSLLLVGGLACMGCISACVSDGEAGIIWGRFVSGLAIGGSSVVVPLYVGEMSPADRRGLYGTSEEITLCCGILLATLMGLPIAVSSPTDSIVDYWWRIMVAFDLIPAIILMVMVCWVYDFESPLFYEMKMKEERDLKSIRSKLVYFLNDVQADDDLPKKLKENKTEELAKPFGSFTSHTVSHRGQERIMIQTSSPSGVSDTRQLIDHNVDLYVSVISPKSSSASWLSPVSNARIDLAGEKQSAEMPWMMILKSKKIRNVLLGGLALSALQQISGICVLMSMSNDIFLRANFTGAQPTYATIGMGAIQLLSTISSAFFIDKSGRKTLMLVGTTGQTLAGLLPTISYWAVPDSDLTKISSVVSVFVFVAAFSFGYGPVAWIYLAEIFPPAARDKCVSACLATNWLSAVVIVMVSTYLSNAWRFTTLTVFSALALILVIFWMKESKGLPLGCSPFFETEDNETPKLKDRNSI